MIYYGLPITWHIIILPFAMLLAFLFGIGISYWLAALIVQFRDIGYFLNIFVQIMVYLSPVAYSSTLVPQKLLFLYHLNPLYWAISFARWAVLGTPIVITDQFYAALAMALTILVTGLFVFARFERDAVDVY
jgi:lipopolysaccharide transport system permease protein